MTKRLVTGGGRLHLAYPGHVSVAEPGSLTDARAIWVGERFRVYTAGANTFQSKDSLVQANGCLTGRYAKTNQLANADQPEEWYSHKLDAAGRVVRRLDGLWGVYAMEPSNHEWRASHGALVDAIFKGHPKDACWFQDSAGSYSYHQAISRGERGPLVPGTRGIYARPDWFDRIRDNLDTWMAAHPDKRMIVNGLEPATMSVYAPTIGMVEGIFKSQHGLLPGLSVWEQGVRFLRDAQAAGWTPWAYCKLPSWQHADLWRPLMLTTMLLADEGSLLYGVSAMEGTAQSWEVPEYDHPWYQLELGAPLSESMLRQGTLAYRFYDKGYIVVANPDDRTQTLDVVGGGSVTVLGRSGGIFQRGEVKWTTI